MQSRRRSRAQYRLALQQVSVTRLFQIFYTVRSQLNYIRILFVFSNEISPDDDPKYQVLQDGTLMIENASDSDMGSYECMAKSPAGEVKSRSVHMKPITAASTSSSSSSTNSTKGWMINI